MDVGVAEHHPGRHVLAEDRVRHAGHGRLGHRRVFEEGGLHLAGHHVVAAPDDDLLLPADDPEMAVGVEVAEVAARSHPSTQVSSVPSRSPR